MRGVPVKALEAKKERDRRIHAQIETMRLMSYSVKDISDAVGLSEKTIRRHLGIKLPNRRSMDSKEVKRRAADLLRNGHSRSDIARMLDRDYHTVTKYLAAEGLGSEYQQAKLASRVQRLARQGVTDSQIMELEGISPKTLRKRLAGTPVASDSHKARVESKQAIRSRVRSLYIEGAEIGDIAEQVGIPKSSLYRHLLDLPKRRTLRPRRKKARLGMMIASVHVQPGLARELQAQRAGRLLAERFRAVWDRKPTIAAACAELGITTEQGKALLRKAYS